MTKEEWSMKLLEASAELLNAAQRVTSGADPLEVEGKVTHVSCVLDILVGDVEGALSREKAND